MDDRDKMRVQDIISKGKWNREEMRKLAETMCKLINKVHKAIGRYEAALMLLPEDHPVVKTFLNKAKDLGADRWTLDSARTRAINSKEKA